MKNTHAKTTTSKKTTDHNATDDLAEVRKLAGSAPIVDDLEHGSYETDMPSVAIQRCWYVITASNRAISRMHKERDANVGVQRYEQTMMLVRMIVEKVWAVVTEERAAAETRGDLMTKAWIDKRTGYLLEVTEAIGSAERYWPFQKKELLKRAIARAKACKDAPIPYKPTAKASTKKGHAA